MRGLGLSTIMEDIVKMDINRKCRTAVFLFAMVCFLSGCRENATKDVAASLTWETVNERVQNASKIAAYDTTKQNGISYYFESGVFSEEDKSRYIADIDTFYTKVREVLPDTASDGAAVYVGDSLSTQGVTGKAFIQSQDIASYQGMTAVLLSAMSETVNYGQAYGITAFLCRDLGLSAFMGQSLYSDDELAMYYGNQENLCLLDFFLPVFEPQYVDGETVAYAQAGAVSFEDYYINRTGLENALLMCVQSAKPESDITLAKEKNEWLETIEADVFYEPASCVIPFSHNLSDDRAIYPYIVITDSAKWYPALADINLIGYTDFICGFADTLKYQETDFAQVREVLHDYIESEIPPVTIYTDFADDSDASQVWGAFYSPGNYIKLYHNWSIAQWNLLHEYVHYLTIRHGTNKAVSGFWAEGIAEEAAVMECENRLADLYMESIMTAENIERAKQCCLWNYEESRVNIRLQRMAEAACMYLGYGNGLEYLSVGQEVIVRTADMAERIRPNWLSYGEAAGMTAYLIETYGREMVYANCNDINRLETVFGKSFLELYDEWGKWNIKKCEEAGIDPDILAEYFH